VGCPFYIHFNHVLAVKSRVGVKKALFLWFLVDRVGISGWVGGAEGIEGEEGAEGEC